MIEPENLWKKLSEDEQILYQYCRDIILENSFGINIDIKLQITANLKLISFIQQKIYIACIIYKNASNQIDLNIGITNTNINILVHTTRFLPGNKYDRNIKDKTVFTLADPNFKPEIDLRNKLIEAIGSKSTVFDEIIAL